MHHPIYGWLTCALVPLTIGGCAAAQLTAAPGTPSPPTLSASPTNGEQALGLRQVAEIPLPGNASRLDYQSIDETRGLLFIAHLGASRVIVFDVKSQQVVADIPEVTSVHGVIAVPSLHRMYAAATGTHQVAVIDEDTLRVIARADGGQYPDGLAFDPENQKVFVSDESGGAVIVIDARTNQRTNRIDLGGEVGNTQYDAMGHQIVAAAQGRNQLALIDPQSEKVTTSIDLPGCDGPHGFYVDSPTRLAFVSCEQNAKLFVVDLGTKQITASDSVGEIPDVLAYDASLQRLFVGAESGVVAVFQTRGRALEKIGQAYLAPNAHTIAVDSTTHRVYIPLENVNGHPVLRIFEPF